MSFVPTFDTTVAPDTLRSKLRQYEPWGHRIDFNNGVTTAELVRRTPFAENALQKLMTVAKRIDFASLRGGSLLDVGCNSGYNSIHAAAHYGMQVTGIDVSPRHMEVSRFLAGLAGVSPEFLSASAETFSRPEAFDVVLHFGTLYHLPNPLLSLQTTYDNLKPGGWMALETQTYDDPKDPGLCYFIHGHNNDKTNFWALSEDALRRYMQHIGFVDVDRLLRVSPPMLGEHMNRVILVTRKPD
jgi:tRNA (mo5U34)-methyltransferase